MIDTKHLRLFWVQFRMLLNQPVKLNPLGSLRAAQIRKVKIKTINQSQLKSETQSPNQN